MKTQKPWQIVAELGLFSLVIGAANIFSPLNPGFLKGYFNPYLLLSFVVAAYYGKYHGFVSLGTSIFVIIVPLPFVLELVKDVSIDGYWIATSKDGLIPLAISLVAVYLFGLIRDTHVSRATLIKEKARRDTRDVALLEKEVDAIQAINLELEERVSRQQDSLTSLYTQIQNLYSLNLEKGLDAVLEAVEQFAGARSCSMWELHGDTKTLELAASRGWDSTEQVSTRLSVENSIEGWVVRNNSPFSVKMLLQYENLRAMDTGRNIITVPVPAGRSIWGVLNIERMPFEKYSQYTEKMVELLVALAAPAVERALEYASVVSQSEINETTGLPSFGTFYRLLERETAHMKVEGSSLCVVLFEISNFASLTEAGEKREVLKLYTGIAELVKKLSHNQASTFHYKDDNQLAILYPKLDTDGAVLFGLDALEQINNNEWLIRDKPVQLEMILGYATADAEKQDVEEVLYTAENLLELQKL